MTDFSGSGGDTFTVEYQQFGTDSTAKTIVQVDVDGDGEIKAGEDFHLELTGHHNLTAADFVFEGERDTEPGVSVVEVSNIDIVRRMPGGGRGMVIQKQRNGGYIPDQHHPWRVRQKTGGCPVGDIVRNGLDQERL